MSKWTSYQLLIVIIFTAIIALNNVYADKIATVFSFTEAFISPSILIIFFTVIFIIWGFSSILLLQEKKEKHLFEHKLWRSHASNNRCSSFPVYCSVSSARSDRFY